MRLKVILCLTIALLFIGVVVILGTVKRSTQTNMNISEERIESIEYMKEGINAKYPKFVEVGDNEYLTKLNDVILKDFNKILQIYAFNPFPEPEPGPTKSVQIPTILNIIYELKLNNPKYTSIYYLASFKSSFSAYPTDLVYTTNIDKTKGSRIVLGDIVKLDKDFVSSFRSWNLVGETEYPDFIKQAIKEYTSNISDEDLLSGMKAADKIGSGNLLDIYTYLTPDSLGISIGVPNYLGDHVDFEMNYNNLKPYLNPESSLSFHDPISASQKQSVIP